MDGTAACIISVLQLSFDVLEYIIGATGATKARRRLREDIPACEDILLQLQEHAENTNGGTKWRKTIKVLADSSTPLYRLGITLETIKTDLEPKRGWIRCCQL